MRAPTFCLCRRYSLKTECVQSFESGALLLRPAWDPNPGDAVAAEIGEQLCGAERVNSVSKVTNSVITFWLVWNSNASIIRRDFFIIGAEFT